MGKRFEQIHYRGRQMKKKSMEKNLEIAMQIK